MQTELGQGGGQLLGEYLAPWFAAACRKEDRGGAGGPLSPSPAFNRGPCKQAGDFFIYFLIFHSVGLLDYITRRKVHHHQCISSYLLPVLWRCALLRLTSYSCRAPGPELGFGQEKSKYGSMWENGRLLSLSTSRERRFEPIKQKSGVGVVWKE